MLKGNWYISIVWRMEKSVDAFAPIVANLFRRNRAQSVNTIFLICQEQNVKLLMSQCFTCWLKRKYRKHSIIEHHYIWSLSILRFAARINVFFYAIQVDVLRCERRGLTLRNGMILVSRKSLMTTLKGVAT